MKNKNHKKKQKNKQKRTLISSPTSTGGGGTVFEHHVGAYWLAQLLVGAIPPILIDCSVSRVLFQTEHLGWNTDDVLIVARTTAGVTRKLVTQVKRTFTISAVDEECKKAFRDFWADFNNPVVFSATHDRFVLITQLGTNTLLREFGNVLECARSSHDPKEFAKRLATPGFVSNTAKRQAAEIVDIINENTNDAHTLEDLHGFLRVLHVLSLDLMTGTAQAEAEIKRLLALTAIGDDKAATADQTWNELFKQASIAAPTASSYERNDLPATVRSKHNNCGIEHPAICALSQHGSPVLKLIRTSIGLDLHLKRAQLVQDVLAALNESQIVLVTGPAGVGKSAVAKEVIASVANETFTLAFRAEEMAKPHLDAVLSAAQIPARSEEIRGILAAQPRKVVLIESVERLLEAQTRDAIADLLELAGSDPTFRLLLTCRDYSADLIRAAFLTRTTASEKVIQIPNLTDEELSEVSAAFPDLRVPLSNEPLKRILKNPYVLDKALQIRWLSTDLVPTDERAFRELFWRDIIRVDDERVAGMPIRRQQTFIEVALRRARQLSPYVVVSDLDSEAVSKLVASSLLTVSEQNDSLYTPSHDVLEDWAILRWLDEIQLADADSFLVLSRSVGSYPALRRAYRKWVAELVSREPGHADELFQQAVSRSDVPSTFIDDTLVSLLRSELAGDLLKRHTPQLLADDNKLLKRLIHLIRVACVTVPQWVPSNLSIFNIPVGTAWAAVLSIVRSQLSSISNSDNLLVVGLLEDWAKGISPYTPYPQGSRDVAQIAYLLLERFRGYSFEEERKRLLQIIAQIPDAEVQRFTNLLAYAPTDRRSRDRLAEDFQKIVLTGMRGTPAARDIPAEVATALKRHVLLQDHLARNREYGYSHLGVEPYFGVVDELRHDYFPPSAYRTPMLPLLRFHSEVAVPLLIQIFNASAEWYADPLKNGYLEELHEVELRFPDGRTRKQWCNDRWWRFYRGSHVSPHALESFLMAFERWLRELAKAHPENLDGILLAILKASNNCALAAVAAALASEFPFQCTDTLITLLSVEAYIVLDRQRMVADSSFDKSMFSGLLGVQSGENRIYEQERKEADSWPHRTTDLEAAVRTLQLREPARVQAVLDEHYRMVAEKTEQTEGDKLWRLSLHRMDIRKYRVADDQPPELRDKGYVKLEGVDPEPDLRQMIEENAPRFEKMNQQMSLSNWGLKVFNKERSDTAKPEDWRSKLDIARAIENNPPSDPMDRLGLGAPAIVAAVCVRDRWEELNSPERLWCVETICTSVLEAANNWDQTARLQKFSVGPDRCCAWALVSLMSRELQEPSASRVRDTFTVALTHPVDEVRLYAGRGLADLWTTNRELVVKAINAIAYEARLLMTTHNAERRKPYDKQKPYDRLAEDAAAEIRSVFWQPGGIPSESFDELNLEEWHGEQAALRTLAILNWAPDEVIARTAFVKAAEYISTQWRHKYDRDDRRQRNYEAEAAIAKLLEQFAMTASDEAAVSALAPVIQAIDKFPGEARSILEGLIVVEDTQRNTAHFWKLWSMFRDKICGASWIANVDARHSSGSELLHVLFLGICWKEEARHWPSLEGHAHHIHLLFEQLPPSSTALDAYVRFLYHIGEQSLPASFIRIASRLKVGDADQMLAKENTIFMLEVLLQRFVYPKPRELKEKPLLREAVLFLLDTLVQKGSSAAFRMRDDFVTPISGTAL